MSGGRRVNPDGGLAQDDFTTQDFNLAAFLLRRGFLLKEAKELGSDCWFFIFVGSPKIDRAENAYIKYYKKKIGGFVEILDLLRIDPTKFIV